MTPPVSGYGCHLFYHHCVYVSLSLSLKSIFSSLLMVIESVLYRCIYRFYAVVWCCAWNLLVLTCFCFCRSSGCALDCCPLSRHCPLDPKAVWLPLQATVPMATFHSHLFSIWLWHIHLDMDTEITVNNNHAPARTGRQKSISNVFEFRRAVLHLIHQFKVLERVYAKWLHMCQLWVLLGLEVLCSDVSGVDTAILFHPTMQPCMISSSGSAPRKKIKKNVFFFFVLDVFLTKCI